MADFVSNPVTVNLIAPSEPYKRADLVIHGIDHAKASYECRLFINNPDAGPQTPTSDNSYVGSFWIFGHGGCAGDEGHCEPPRERRPFDFRIEHQLTPVSKIVVITEKLRALVPAGQQFTLRLVPWIRPESAARLPSNLISDVLDFERADLVTYQ
jgi:tyrosinase